MCKLCEILMKLAPRAFDDREPSKRLEQWHEFSFRMVEHIENYTVPQYGDFPDDPLTTMSDEVIVANMGRYLARVGKNARGADDACRDMLKVAHYACELERRLREEAQHDEN